MPERSAKPNPFFLQAAKLPPVDRRHFLGLLALTCGWTMVSAAEGDKKGKGGGGKGGGGDDQSKARGPSFQGEYVLPEALAEFSRLSVVLGRASDKTVTLSLLAAEAMEAVIELGTTPGKYARKIGPLTLPKGEPVEVVVDKLTANTEYFYRLQSRFLKASGGAFTARPECRFATQRAPGSSFVFTIQGDSHPERPQSSHPDLYARTLQAASAERPDFHICIGDDFSVDKVRTVSPAALAQPYLLQRPFLGLIGQQASVFLMNGNHEQGSLFNYQQTDERRDVAVGVQQARNRLFPTVGPDGFYTGCQENLKGIGPLKTYCAWTWGDALFVILDNYWHSPALVDSGYGEKAKGTKGDDKKNRDWWGITIGDAQYQWLKRTLETSKAKYKFVFAHHVLGSGRGGVDEADLYEWGGQGKRGEGSFKEKRPGWELPIHQLMVKHKVNVFFQGHDHLYCKQEKDGIVYQEVPMPSDHGYVAYNEDRYQSGTKLPSSGYLRVSVSPQQTKVEYVRCFLPKDETKETRHGMVAHAYDVKPRTA
ncbi:MAG: metallophosphoesterase [Verrucomicrobiota bacterium]